MRGKKDTLYSITVLQYKSESEGRAYLFVTSGRPVHFMQYRLLTAFKCSLIFTFSSQITHSNSRIFYIDDSSMSLMHSEQEHAGVQAENCRNVESTRLSAFGLLMPSANGPLCSRFLCCITPHPQEEVFPATINPTLVFSSHLTQSCLTNFSSSIESSRPLEILVFSQHGTCLLLLAPAILLCLWQYASHLHHRQSFTRGGRKHIVARVWRCEKYLVYDVFRRGSWFVFLILVYDCFVGTILIIGFFRRQWESQTGHYLL